jgi:hypothetical protein
LQWALGKKLNLDGIAIVSDGGDNSSPLFAPVYNVATQVLGKQVPVYHYLTKGEPNVLGVMAEHEGIPLTTFDLRGGFDYYSLPNLVQTMRANRYDLGGEILETPLLTLADVFKDKKEVMVNVRG